MMGLKEWIGMGAALALSGLLSLAIRRYPAAIWLTSFVAIAITLSMFQRSRVMAILLVAVTIAFLLANSAAARWPTAPMFVAIGTCLCFVAVFLFFR
jgi:hypothetical protein